MALSVVAGNACEVYVTEAAQLLAQVPSDPPRPIGRHVRRRSWGDRRVRIWWILAAALTLIAAFWAATQILSSMRDRWLMRYGIEAQGTIIEAGGNPTKNKKWEPALRLSYKMTVSDSKNPGAPRWKPYEVEGRLRYQDRSLGPDDVVTLYIDPRNGLNWTDRNSMSFLDDVVVALILLPIAGILLIAAIVARFQALRAWRDGKAMAAVVVESRRSPIAPMSRAVRYTLRDSRDSRVRNMLIPDQLGVLKPGDVFWVVVPPSRPDRAVLAALYY